MGVDRTTGLPIMGGGIDVADQFEVDLHRHDYVASASSSRDGVAAGGGGLGPCW